MEQVMSTVLLLSAAGALLAVLLLSLKPVTKRLFGSRWQYYIWLCVLVVMMLPIKVELPGMGDWHIQLPQVPQTAQPFPQLQEQQGAGSSAAPAPVQTGAAVQEQTQSNASVSLLSLLCGIWMLGAGIFLAGGLISYLRFWKTIKKHAEDFDCSALAAVMREKKLRGSIRVKKTGLLTAPLMAGLLRPVLLLPDQDLEDAELNFILKHELTHYKRRDLWYKWFAFLVNAVHWFNPFIYMVVRQISEECEISCDLAVTKNMSEEEKKGYMATIVRLASGRSKGGKSDV